MQKRREPSLAGMLHNPTAAISVGLATKKVFWDGSVTHLNMKLKYECALSTNDLYIKMTKRNPEYYQL